MIFNLRTQKARSCAQQVINRQQALLERSFSRRVRAVLDKQYAATARRIARSDTNIDKAVDAYANEMLSVFSQEYAKVGARFYLLTRDSYNGTRKETDETIETKGMLSAFWQAFNRYTRTQAAQKVTYVTATTKTLLQQIVELGQSMGDSYGVIADSIWASTGDDFNMKRSMRIARTEVHAASSFATQTAVESTSVPFKREWIAMRDERTRLGHRHAHGQVRAMDEPFVVSGEELMYPGDPNGSAGNVINCRCVLIYLTASAAASRRPTRQQEQRQYAGMGDAWA